jgi:hypothetical protein
VTNSDYGTPFYTILIDHVAMVLRSTDDELFLYEANSDDVIYLNFKTLGSRYMAMEEFYLV